MSTPVGRIYLALAVVGALVGAGTGGYMLLDHMSFMDALYMTVITITTVGYGEVKPLDTVGRIFTMGLIFTGVGAAYLLFGAVTETVVGGQFRELIGRNAMNRKIDQLQNHVILCGYGRFGRVVAEELRRTGVNPVIIERDPGKEAELAGADAMYVMGSALDEKVLERAGIATAAHIVIATASDPDNVFVSLSARSRNPHVRIHARAETEVGLKHLRLAGVDRAISSYQWSAMRIAGAIARPSVVDFLGLILPGRGDEEIDIEEITIPRRSNLNQRSIADIEQSYDRVRIVALKRGAEPISLIPTPTTQVCAEDLLIVIGSRTSLGKLAAAIDE